MPVLDDHDKRIVRETQNGTYTYVGSVSGKKGLIDNEADAGGYENYGSETRPADFDTDMDGLPDWWENLYGTNTKSAVGDFSDTNADPDKDGYTAMEDYLEWMSLPHFYLTSTNKSAIVNLDSLSVGYVKSPVYTLTNSVSGLNVDFNGGKATVTANTASDGIYYLNFKVTDSESSSITRKIGIYVGATDPTAVRKVEMPALNSVSIYPVLFNNQLNIITNIGSNAVLVQLEDLTGKVVLQKKYDLQQGKNNLTLNCPTSLPQQLYVVKITDQKTGEKIVYRKVIKE
jgi:hypothetical protein